MKGKLIKTILASTVGIAPVACCALTAVACQDDIQIDSIQLYPEVDNIRPGETRLIRAVALPDYHRITNLSWELLDCQYPEISINSTGRVVVNTSLIIDEPIVITIKASLPDNPKINNTTQMTVLPGAIGDFQGFRNNEIQFVNYEGKIDSVQLTKIDEKTYVTSRNIDVFEADMSPVPEGWTSRFNFEALVAGDNPNFMSFTLVGGDYTHHMIQWGVDYDDSSWTRDIPWFDTVHNTYVFDKILVRFSCDLDVTLTINLTGWQKPEQDAPCMYTYIPSSGEITENPVTFVEQGIYKLSIPCPGTARQGIITQEIDSIYAYRHKFFYTDFDFDFEFRKDLDDDIKNMFTYFQSSDPVLVERPFDAVRSYKMKFSYQIDLSRRQYTYEHWDYNDIFIGTLYAEDPLIQGSAANLEVWLVWEN